MQKTQIVAEPGLPQIIITREFEAPRELLFRAHTDPELLTRWLGPDWLSTTVDCLDARHGGRWRYTHRDAKGDTYSFHGLYHGDPTPDRIVQTYEFDQQPGLVYLNTITFAEHEDRTVLRQNTVFPSVEARDGYVDAGMEDGVNASMDKLDTLVTGLTQSTRPGVEA
jgi:uncharacterized protein YndB with AHSA1/START domain